MAGKRHLGTMDQTMYSKMIRAEAAPQHSLSCPGKTIHKDLPVCKNILTYPLSTTEGQHSFNQWSSTAAYLQYAGNALNQHLHSGGVSKCQRPETDRLNNLLQSSDNSSSNFSAQSHPVHNYHMSPSRAYPAIAIPRPVYRSPSSFIEPVYQSQDFQSIGVHAGSQTLCPPAVEWSPPTRFSYSSSPLYLSGIKNLHPTHNRYFEGTGGMSSIPRNMQENSPVHRHRTGLNTAMGTSPSCYQEDVFTDRVHPFAQHNMQVLCADSSSSLGKPRHSAFTTPTPEHYKCVTYQGSPDNRMGHMYAKTYYDSAMDSYHQRSSLYSCSVDKSLSPVSMKDSMTYVKAQKLHSSFVNPEARAITQSDRTQTNQTQAELELQINNMAKVTRDPQMYAVQKGNIPFGSGPINRDVCANIDKEHVVGSVHVNSNLHERAFYEKCTKEQRSHVFLQQNSSAMMSAVPTKSVITNEPVKDSSLTSKSSLSTSSLHTHNDKRLLNATFSKQTVQNHSETEDTAHANSTKLNSSVPSGSIYHRQMSNDNQTSLETGAEQKQGSSLPQVETAGPKSPPMPVINDVFSLAPYRAYLEGKAPHPFPVHQDSTVESSMSTSFFSQPSSSSEQAEEAKKDAFKLKTIPAVVNVECHDSGSTQQQTNGETGEKQHVHISSDTMDTEVLDLSLKKSIQTSSSSQDQVNVSHSDDKLSTQVSEGNLSNISEELSINSQGTFMSSVTRRTPNSEKVLHVSHTTAITSSPNKENTPSKVPEKISHFAQDSCSNAKTYTCQSQDSCTSQAPETLAQEHKSSLNQSSRASNATQSVTHENLAKHSFQTNKCLLSPLRNNYSYQAIRSQPPYFNEKCKSGLTKNLTQKREEYCTSQSLKHFTPQGRHTIPFQISEGKADQLHKSHKSHANKHQSFQSEMQSHIPEKTCSSQTPEAPQLQQNCSNRTSETPRPRTTETFPHHSYYHCLSKPLETYSVNSSTLFVNAFQTPTPFFTQANIYSPPAAVFCAKNLNLPSYQHQNRSSEPTEGRTDNSGQSEISPSGSENEGPGFQSSKAFMMRKYKMRKLSNSEPEVQEANSTSTRALPRTFRLPSDAVQSLPPSAPESSPTLGEANVSLASADELAPNGSGQQFSELHRLVRAAVTNSIARSPSNLLEDWLEKTKDSEGSKNSVKAKSGSRPNDPSPESPCHDIWQDFDGVRLHLHKLLSQLETFMFTRSCPFPHVIRAGAIFIPIYLVKEVLFPELGSSVDRVLQKHKVELRPTTLSEEKLLRETELKDCPSRMLKLLALKQLPDVYPDLLHLFCDHTIQNHLGNCFTKEKENSEYLVPKPLKETHTESPRKGKASLIMRIKQVCKSPGSRVYKALQLKPLEKRSTEKLQTRKVCRKKSYKDRTLITYKRRRRVRSAFSKSKQFPDLVGKRILHLFDDGDRETWFPGRVLRVHRRSRKLRDTQYEVWYDSEPGTRYFLELLQDYEKGWLKLDS